MTTLRFRLLPTLTFLLLAASGATAQQTFRSEIVVANNGAGVDTLRWGIESGATYGIDAPLGEYEWPPFPVSEVFEVRFVNLPGRSALGEGVKLDLRDPRDANQIDTFNIRIQAGTGGYPVTVSWPASLAAKARSLRFVTLLDDVDMLATTSMTITNPGIQQAMIIREGDAVSAVGDEAPAAEAGAVLEAIAPNPTSGVQSASVVFTIRNRSAVSIRLYDVLGRERATLLDDMRGGGRHEVSLPTAGLEPGSYYCTLVVGERLVASRMVIVD